MSQYRNRECNVNVSPERLRLEHVMIQSNERLDILGLNYGDIVSDFKTARCLGCVWLDALSEFSLLSLSRDSDRLPSLFGLACLKTVCLEFGNTYYRNI